MNPVRSYLVACIFFALALWVIGCDDTESSNENSDELNYRNKMRYFVQDISAYAKEKKPDFLVIPQNGEELLTNGNNPNGTLNENYIAAIDGQAREDLFYGYSGVDKATPANQTDHMLAYMQKAKEQGLPIIVTDYVSSYAGIDSAYKKNAVRDFVSFSAPKLSLSVIPDYPKTPINENNRDISALSEVSNFLYLINPKNFDDKEAFIDSVTATNYDLLIMDYFFNGDAFTEAEVERLHQKADGGRRLVICYLSIGEAEDYRYYWKSFWHNINTPWLGKENDQFPGNYLVRYWMPKWQRIIYGNPSAYLDKILSNKYDGVYLDLIDAFEYYESNDY